MKVTCTSCTKRFDGRRDAKTCSPRCRKRLQRLILAASQVTHEVGDEIKDEIKQVEQAVETSARALVSNQEGFALVDEPGAVATAPPTTTISPQTVTPMPAPQVSIPNPAPTPIAVAREPQPAPVNVQPTPAPIPVVPEPKTVSTVPIRPAPTPISSPVSTIPGPTFPIQPKPQPSLPINDIYAKPTPSSFEPAKPSTNSSSLSNLGYYETPVKSVTNGPVVSSYSAPQANYLVNSSLEVHDPGNIPLPTKEKPKQNNYYSTGVSPFSRRRTKVLASLVVAGIVIFSSVGFLVAGRQTPLFQKAKQGVSPQDISLRDNVLTTAPQALQGTNKAIFVNGDIITNSTLKVVNGNTTTTIGLDNPTSDHEVKFPDASGTVCLTTNNCSFATTGELTALQRQVANNSANNTTSTSSNNNGVSSVNNATGDITIQGTPNQVNVTTSGTTITLSTPQDINTNSDVQFGSLNLSGDLTLGPGSTLFTNGIIQTGTGNDISINAGSDNIVFTAGGRTFQFPTSGPGSQTICTTGVTCASGGGQAVLLAPGSVQNDNTVDASIFINDTGGGNLLQFQSGGVDRFVVSNSGGITAASLTLGSPLTIPNGGTGATTASGARTNLGAAASGANADITSTTALNTITPSAALTVGATGQSFVLQGNASSTITATGGGFTTTIGFAGTPVGNITYNFDRTASAGTYTICTTAGNCVGTGGGVSTPGGTTNRVAKFTAAQSIGDSNISDDGTTVTILSALGINGNVTVGDASTDRVTFTSQILGANPLVFQGATDNASTTTFAITDPTALRTITFPNASGTVAVSASGNIALDSFGNITFTGTLPVGNGGTGATSFTSNGVIYGNGAGALQVTSAGTPGQVLLANASGVPTFTTLSGDVTVNSTGATTIQPDSVALGTDTTGNYVTSLTAGNGISVGAAGESATPTVALAALTADWNQTGAFDITLNNASSELKILESAGATFFGTLDVGDLTANRTYVLPDLTAASDTICLVTLGNCAGSGGGVTTSGGTTNRVAKFTGANSIGDSTISDDGTNVSLTGNLSIQGGTVNLGVASTTTGSLNLYNGASANAGTLQVSSLGQATTFNLPDPGAASVDICLSSGNCVGGGGGGAPNGAAYLTVGNDATLSAERAIAVNATNLSFTDGGANGSYTINTIQGIATTSSPSFAGLTLTGNLNLGANTLQGTTAIIDFTNFDVASNGNVTAGTFNSQTISSAANFTGTLAVTTLGSASTDTVICRNGSNQLATCNSTFATTANAFLQGGNSFGTTAILGTNDANSLNIRTNSTTAISIDTSQNTTFSGNIVVAANKSLTLNGGNTASRPASPTEGMVYYDTTTKQLLTYANGKWQADRTTATKIVAASNSSQAEKDAADYVADGTGDQVEINAALTAASGGKVYLMEGTYVANATILIPNNTTLAGAGRGTDIELADIDATDNLIENSDTSTGTGITIRDLRIDGRNDLNTAGVQHGVYLNGMGGGSGASVRVGAKLSNLYVANFRGNGFGNCIYLINSRGNTLINNRAENCRFGFFLETSPNNTLSNNFAENNGSEGFYVYNSSDNTVLDGNTASNSHEGFDLESSSGITLTNNIAEDSAGGGDGIFIYQVSNSVVSGNISRNNAGEGIYLLDSSNITVTGNSITQSGYDGIGIETSDSNVVSGNKISDSGQTDGTGDGIYLTTADNNSITGNTITDTAGIDYAINIFNSTSDKTYLSNNTFSGTGASSINDLGTGTVYANQARGQNGAQLTVRTANATDAFQIQNATGSALFTADTTNQRIGIGDTTPAYALTVGNGDLFGVNSSGNVIVTALGAASTDTVICRNGSNQLATCNSTFATTANAFLQGGNSFGTTATLGTNDANSLNIRTNSTTAISVDTSQNTTFNGNLTVAANKSLTLTGGNTASRPGSPTEGMVYYDTTTKQLLTYANGKWQGDRTTATKIVAASNSSQTDKDGADYIGDGENSSGSGTGTIDGDQIEINNALTAVSSAGGGIVYLTAGTFTIDDSISIPNNVTLAGSGPSTIVQLGNFGSTSTSINMITNTDTSTGTRVTVRDLKLDGRKSINTNGTQVGIKLLVVGNGTNRPGAKVTGVYIENVLTFGIWLNSAVNSTISGNTFMSNPSALVMSSSNYNTISGNTIMASTDAVTVNGSLYNTFSGNVIQGNSGKAISTDGSAHYNTYTANTLQNNTNGIYLNGSNNTITSNVFSGNTTAGIQLLNNAYNTVGDNAFYDNGGAGNNNAIIIANSDNNIITGNSINDTSCTTDCYAISITSSTSDTNYLSDNRFSTTSGTATINDAGTGTVYANQARGQNGAQLTTRTANATDAFQIQNATGSALFTVDSTNSEIEFGKPGASGIDGKLVIYNAANANTITLTTGTTSSSYSLVLPTTSGSANQCLANGATPGTLTFTACGGGTGTGGTVTLQDAYNNSSSPATITTADGKNLRISLQDTTTDQTFEISQAGTANAFRVNDDGTFTDSTPFIIDASGNVGIGTTGPAQPLHVVSTSRTVAVLAGTSSSTSFTADAGQLQVLNTNTTNNNWTRIAFADAEGGNAAAGIGTQITDHTNDYGQLSFWTRDSGGFGQRLTILENGNVGIGDTTPAALLTVGNGDLFQVNSSGDITTASNENLGITAAGTGDINVTTDADTFLNLAGLTSAAGTGLCIDGSNNVVTCSTGSSSATLQSAYNAGNTITTTDARNIDITLADTTTDQTFEISQAGTADALRVNDDGTFTDSSPFVIDANGNVGIGTTTASSKLTVNGDVRVTSGDVRIDSGNKFYFESAGTNNALYRQISDGSSVLTTAADIIFGSGGLGSTYVTVKNGGNVGVGDATPAALLTVGNGDLFQVSSAGLVSYVDGTANNNTLVCKNASGQLAPCSSGVLTGNAFVQGGNSFGTTATLGTNDANDLAFETNNVTQATLAVGGAFTLQNSSDSAAALDVKRSSGAGGASVLTVDTTNSLATVRGINSTSSIGSELLTGNCSGTNWSGTGSGPYAHTSGSAAALTCTITGGVTIGATYQVRFTTTGMGSTDTITPAIGGVNGPKTTGNVSSMTDVVTTTSSTNPTFTINNSSSTGSITSISFKLITLTNSVFNVNNSDGSTGLEVRAGGSGLRNIFIGTSAGQANNQSNLVAIGFQALQDNTSGDSNNAVGSQALQNNTTGSFNSALGKQALQNNTIGTTNSAVGYQALQANTTGNNNSAFGPQALWLNTTGNDNATFGYQGLENNTSGSSNTAIGNDTLLNNTTGSNNTALGYFAGSFDLAASSFATPANLSNATAIGYNAQIQASNSLVLGGQGASAVNVGIGTTSPTNTFSVSPDQYDIGTAGTGGSSSTTITGSGTTWTSSMVGSEFIFADGTKRTITAFGSTTSLTVNSAVTEADGSAYRIHYPGLQVTSAGNVGIGDTTPAYALTVGNGDLFGVNSSGNVIVTALGAASTDTVICRNGSNQLATCNSTFATTANAFLQGGNSFGATATLGTNDANDLAFETNNSTKWLIQNSTGAFLPNLDDTYDIGDNTHRVANLYLGGETLHIGTSTSDESLLSYNTTTNSLIAKPAASNDSTSAFQVQNAAGTAVLTVDSTNSATILRGINSDATLGSELVTSQDFTSANWTTCNGGAGGWTGTSTTTTHNTGNTVTCSAAAGNFTVTAGTTYKVTFTIASNTTATNTVAPSIGGVSGPSLGANTTHTVVITASTTGALTFTPTTNFNGVISAVSVKAITTTKSVLTINNSSNTTTLEVRSSGSTTNLFMGLNSGLSNTSSGLNNTALGTSALQSNISGVDNSAIGFSALASSTIGNYNTAVGKWALTSNTSGSQNVALGVSALASNKTGDFNTALGVSALFANSSGSSNVAIGDSTLASNTTGSFNVGVGIQALNGNSTGTSNTGIGYQTLTANTTGSNNTALGYNASYRDPTVTQFVTLGNLSNATAIGYGAQVQASNSLILGGQVANQVNVGIGTTSPTNVLSVSPYQYFDNATTASQSTTTVTGSGTTFTAAMVGSEIVWADGSKATITAFTDTTHLTVTPSQTVSSQKFRIYYAGLQVTSTGNVGIGTTTIGTNNRLIINPYSTVDNLATTQINSNAATNKGLVVQGFTSQSANLQEWQNSAGTAVAVIASGGAIRTNSGTTNSFGTTTAIASTIVNVTTGGNPSFVGLKVTGAASQSGDLFQLVDSGTNPIGGFNSTGQLYLGRPSTTVGTALFYGSGSANAISLVGPTSPGSGLTLTLPNETGTLCSTGSVCTGYQATVTASNGLTKSVNDIQLGGTLTQNTTIDAASNFGVTLTSTLSGGARSTYPLTISQASNGSNDSSVGLLQLTNSDSGSTAAVLKISNSGNGTGIDLGTVNSSAGKAITVKGMGTGFFYDTSTTTLLGSALVANGSTTGSLSDMTQHLISLAPGRTNTATSGTVTDSANFLNLARANTQNGAGGTFAITGALANLQSNCTQTAGTCTDSSNILALNQQYTNASGAVLNVANSGTGAGANFTQTTGTAITLATTSGTGLAIANIDTGTGLSVGTNGTLSTGTGLRIDVPLVTSGSGIKVGSNASGILSGFTGSYVLVNPVRTSTRTSGTTTDSGNFLNLTRANTQNGAGGTFAITGDLATLSSNCTQTAGTCTDSGKILSLTQSYANASGDVLAISGAGTGALLRVTDSTATARDVLTIADGGATTFRNQTDSTTGFQVQNAAGNTVFGVDISGTQAVLGKPSSITGKLLVNNSTNSNTITVQSGATSSSYTLTLPTAVGASGDCLKASNGTGTLTFGSCGGGGTSRTTLVPEYPGAALSPDGTNNSGTMTSDFCSKTNGAVTDINTGVCVTAGDKHNYYSWTSSSGDNDYDIYVRYQATAGFSASSTINVYGWRTDNTNNDVQVSVYNASGNQCGTTTSVATGTATWTETAIGSMSSDTDCTGIVANDVLIFKIHMIATASEFARVGEIRIDY